MATGTTMVSGRLEWEPLHQPSELDALLLASSRGPMVIFKHSTRCNISAMAKGRLERDWRPAGGAMVYLIDVLSHREVSNAVADRLGITHESPQVMVVWQGKAVYVESHSAISAAGLEGALAAL